MNDASVVDIGPRKWKIPSDPPIKCCHLQSYGGQNTTKKIAYSVNSRILNFVLQFGIQSSNPGLQ